MGRSALARAGIGLAIVVVVGVVGFYGTRFAQGAFEEEYSFTVVVGESGQGLVQGSDVAARGVLIGQVGAITLTEDLQAEVQLVLEPQYRIPADAQFAVIGKTLFGEKQLEVRFDGDIDQAEEYIAQGAMVTSPEQVVEVQDVLEDLDILLGAINPDDLAVVVNDGLGAFVGQEEAISRAIDQGARATNVLARSLDDQTPTLRDLSLVAEALGPVGDEFNRIGSTIDGGALDTITENQQRLRVLLDELNAFSDQLDVVLELTRPDLDRLMVEGDNVTRVLFAYRPELADLLIGINDYTDTIGNGGQRDPGFSGLAAGFLIILENPFAAEFCGGLPPELAAVLPACSAGAQADAQTLSTAGLGEAQLPVLSVPEIVGGQPEAPARGGLEDILEQVTGDLVQLRGGAS